MHKIEHKATLDEYARKIKFHADKSEDHLITAALFFREAREYVESGAAGDIKWAGWAWNNIDLSKSRLREIMQIADAEDPAEELERLRELNRERVRKHRQKKAAEAWKSDKNKCGLIDWTKKAPPHYVDKLFQQAQRLWECP